MSAGRSSSCSCGGDAHECSCSDSRSSNCSVGDGHFAWKRGQRLRSLAHVHSQQPSNPCASWHQSECSCSCSCDCSCSCTCSSHCSCSWNSSHTPTCSCNCSSSWCVRCSSSLTSDEGRSAPLVSGHAMQPLQRGYSAEFMSIAPYLLRIGTVPPRREPEALLVRMFPTPSGLLPPPEPLTMSVTTTTETSQSVAVIRSPESTSTVTTVSSNELRTAMAAAKTEAVVPTLRSVGIQTDVERCTRGASPVQQIRMDASTATEVTLQVLEQQQLVLEQQAAVMRQHLERCAILEKQLADVGREYEAFCESAKRAWDHQAEATFLQLAASAERARSEVELQEVERRALLQRFMDASRLSLVSLQQHRVAQDQILMEFAHRQQVSFGGSRYELVVDELWHRRAVMETEAESLRQLDFLRCALAEIGRAEEAAVAATLQAEQAKQATLAVQRDLEEALQREKELQLKYLYALRMPTATIVSCDHKTHGGTASDCDELDYDMPVHVRFARAHRAAAEAVSAKRRCGLELRSLL